MWSGDDPSSMGQLLRLGLVEREKERLTVLVGDVHNIHRHIYTHIHSSSMLTNDELVSAVVG